MYRRKAIQEIEKIGLAGLISSEEVMNQAHDDFPDSFGLSDAQIKELPPFVRNFKCGVQIENGDPYCKQEKFNMTLCKNRKFRTSWHPGWKWQALMGNLAALFLIEVLDEALKELAADTTDPATLLAKLKAQEDADYQVFQNAPVPENFKEILPKSERDSFDYLDLLIKGHTFCHTGRLPAEIRHKGILTESTKTGFLTFDKGVELNEAQTTMYDGAEMRLVYTGGDRQVCEVATNHDYKDYFFVNRNEDWKKLVLPNNSEMKEYGTGRPLPLKDSYLSVTLFVLGVSAQKALYKIANFTMGCLKCKSMAWLSQTLPNFKAAISFNIRAVTNGNPIPTAGLKSEQE